MYILQYCIISTHTDITTSSVHHIHVHIQYNIISTCTFVQIQYYIISTCTDTIIPKLLGLSSPKLIPTFLLWFQTLCLNFIYFYLLIIGRKTETNCLRIMLTTTWYIYTNTLYMTAKFLPWTRQQYQFIYTCTL